jgi:poly-gamma-glutamate synthesis protein (capsule biosynthesis protein)
VHTRPRKRISIAATWRGRPRVANERSRLYFSASLLLVTALFVALSACAARPRGTAAARTLTLIAGGDLELGQAADPLRALEPWLRPRGAALRLVNLEGPLTDGAVTSGLDAAGRPRGDEPIRFAAPVARAAWLRGRFDVVTIANNHADDQGEAGRTDTYRALAAQGVRVAGPETPLAIEAGGRQVVVLARHLPGPLPGPAGEDLVAAVGAARPALVIVSLHWGEPGSLLPSPEQRALGRRLVEAGARLVFGHGPHTMQGIERHPGGVVAYSLGNLAFSCRCSDEEDGYLLAVTLDGAGEVAALRPLLIRAGLGGAPAAPSEDAEQARLLDELSAALR